MGVTREYWMQQAITLAQQAAKEGEVPVGAVLVKDGEIVGRGLNRMISDSDPTAHAEIVALRDAASSLGNYRLPGTELYVTIEPCMMCAGALVHARVSSLYFGAREPRAGSVVSTHDLLQNEALNHHLEITDGVCQEACAEMMTSFFREKR
ncbi:MAG: tRNA adenosine(34) deaminase TadA [Gammaproteobacteria bacterium]|nr:tRNA adenosine(34) deaminase TadA [Gammaproteobacteria bacterium]